MKKAKLTFEGKAIELDVIVGSENEIGIDISRLKTDSGFITLDPGFKNTGSCESKVTFLDGDNGILRYRGYSIEDLANNADFLEVSYLLIYGELPTKKQYKKLLVDIQERSVLDEDVKKILENEDIFGRGNKLEKVDINNSYPTYITKNKDKLSDWII